ncbi:ABC transporter ATP-binding protein [Pseudooceanicola sediminis]|uniref:Spermidine/putrescine import ATP-binding protein PotA n=1 Tax=Pseudooceanicola sediminis TaxID=2211117 RepID=A0A399IYE0_9RHOB|nr:ABC transporter ATP-binding protein [Pseudooceanicola sediminis]KAA2316093.1 ABC transporter ATP-binding protein [Puniceibacterium sp. HSS470]RII38203.1 ABC transporter ATP-binding protein [Pseudooceanicola sediminis]|tara:strand:+ start:16270 stop:17394 length:1125 start_codon:yes stop_codon:yes gene_type:complete
MSSEIPRNTPQDSRQHPAVQIDGVAKSFSGTVALEPVWLKIRRGEFLTLLGPSGCGKTTLLNLIAGFLEADEGELFINRDLVTQVPPHQREIGIVFQNYALFPHMNVAQNVAYGLRTRRVSKAETAERVREALALVKLEDFADRRPRQLSGGQQQRVALARALVIRPRVLLLDEPFSALDRNLRTAMQVELKEIQSRLGLTTVFVTHDQSEALSMSDRIAVMSRGRIRQIGTPTEIYDQPQSRFVSTFVGDANLFSATLREKTTADAILEVGSTRLTLSTYQVDMPAPGPVTLFVRPEQCVLTDSGKPDAIPATVALSVYQGSYAELHLDCPSAEGGRVMLRVPASQALPAGASVGIALPQRGPAIYAREDDIA